LPQLADVSRSVSLWQPEGGGHVGFPMGPSIWDFPAQLTAMPDAVLGFLAQHL
jgi:uncharacterized protein